MDMMSVRSMETMKVLRMEKHLDWRMAHWRAMTSVISKEKSLD